jgi:hypothetical protein
MLVSVVLALGASLHAQSYATRTPLALGLLRLKSPTRSDDAAPLAADKFSVGDLSVTAVAGASKANRNNVEYIALDSGKEWARPLRRHRRGEAPKGSCFTFSLISNERRVVSQTWRASCGWSSPVRYTM